MMMEIVKLGDKTRKSSAFMMRSYINFIPQQERKIFSKQLTNLNFFPPFAHTNLLRDANCVLLSVLILRLNLKMLFIIRIWSQSFLSSNTMLSTHQQMLKNKKFHDKIFTFSIQNFYIFYSKILFFQYNFSASKRVRMYDSGAKKYDQR